MAIAHPPGRHTFDVGALAAAQDLGGHPKQAQAFAGPLDGALGKPGRALQLFVGRPGVAAGVGVGSAGEGGRDRDQGAFGDAP